jgi:hypothetical protein
MIKSAMIYLGGVVFVFILLGSVNAIFSPINNVIKLFASIITQCLAIFLILSIPLKMPLVKIFEMPGIVVWPLILIIGGTLSVYFDDRRKNK